MAAELMSQAKGVKADSLTGTAATWEMEKSSLEWLLSESKVRGVLAHKGQYGEEAACLQEMIVYGMKGVAAYAAHAQYVGKEDNTVLGLACDVV